MAKICDTEMCDEMQEARKSYIRPALHGLETGPLQLTVALGPKHVKIVKIRYCPFCGTRISPGVVGLLT